MPRGRAPVTAVTSDADLLVLATDGPTLAALLAFLAEHRVRTRFVLGRGAGEGTEMLVAVPLADVHGADALRAELDRAFGGAVRAIAGLGTVTVVGTGVGTEPRLLGQVLTAALAGGIPVEAVHTGPLHITLLVPVAQLAGLTRALHRLTGGDSSG